MIRSVLFLLALPLLALGQKLPFAQETHPAAPDYAQPSNWSALPFHPDEADVVPGKETWISDSLKEVDVFYVHPTIYQKGPTWNASLADAKLNRKVDRLPVRLQASVFNASCLVYAPRYRQAVVAVFRESTPDGQQALELAYGDVRQAFAYFLEHYSQGRPFIIAGHSQGTYHTRRLLAEFIDTTDLRQRMVAAYIIGLTVNKDMYRNLHICESPDETGCYISWMSYRQGTMPDWEYHRHTECVNPLSWKRDTVLVEREASIGSVVFNPRRVKRHATSARIYRKEGEMEFLWVRTRAPWFQLLSDLHIADYGLFYMDIRANVAHRVGVFQGKK